MALTEFIYRTVYEATGIESYARAAHIANKSLDELSRRAEQSEKKVSQAVGRASKVQEEAVKGLQGQTKDLGKRLNEIAATGFRLTFYAITAIAAGQALLQTVIVRGMAQAAAEFEREIDRIADAAELGEARMNALAVSILDFSNKVSANATKVARFFGTAMIMGFPEEQTKAIARVVKKLSMAIIEDFDKSGDALVRLMSLWGMAADQAPILAARLAYMADRTGQNITQELLPILEDAILLVPQIPQEQMLSLLTVAGRFGRDVAQQLPRFLNTVVRAFAREGIGIPSNIVDILLRVPPENVLQVFGPRMARFLNFIRQNRRLYDEILDKMRKLGTVEAAQSDLADRAEQNAMLLSVALAELGETAKTVWTSFGVGALPIFTTFVHVLRNLVGLVGALPGPVKVFSASLFTLGSSIAFALGGSLAIAGVLGAIVNRIADFVQHVPNVQKAFDNWTNFFAALKDARLEGNLGAAITGVRGLWRLFRQTFLTVAPLLTLISLLVFVMGKYADSEFFQKFPWLYTIIKGVRAALQQVLAPFKQMLLYGEEFGRIIGMFFEVSGLKAIFEGLAAGIFAGLLAPLWAVAEVLRMIVKLVELVAMAFEKVFGAVKSVVKILDTFTGGWASRIFGTILHIIGAIAGVWLGMRLFGWIFRESFKPLRVVWSLLKWATLPFRWLLGGFLRAAFGQEFIRPFLANVKPVTRGRWPTLRWVGRVLAALPGTLWEHYRDFWATQRGFALNPGQFMRMQKAWSWGEFLKQIGRMVLFAPGKIGGFLGRLPNYAVVRRELEKKLPRSAGWFSRLGRSLLELVTGKGGLWGWLSAIFKRPMGIVAPGFATGGAAAAGGRGIFAFLRRIPWAAPLSVAWDLLTGVSLPRALGGGAGIAAGGLLGATLGGVLKSMIAGAVGGSIGGPLGAIVGTLVGLAGSIGGYYLGSAIGGLFEGGKAQQEQVEQLSSVESLLQGPIPVRVVNIGDMARPISISMTVQTAPGTTAEQAEEIARRVVEIFSRARTIGELEERERALVTMSPYRR